MYSEQEYTLTVKDAYNTDLNAQDIQLLINSTFNNLRVEVNIGEDTDE